MDIAQMQQKIIPLLARYGVRKASIFGSVARGESRPDSDIDILVEMPEASGLFDFLGLQSDLGEALDRPVDLVEFDTIKPRLKPYILHDQKPLYQA